MQKGEFEIAPHVIEVIQRQYPHLSIREIYSLFLHGTIFRRPLHEEGIGLLRHSPPFMLLPTMYYLSVPLKVADVFDVDREIDLVPGEDGILHTYKPY